MDPSSRTPQLSRASTTLMCEAPGSATPSVTMARQLQGRDLPQVQRQHRPSTIHHELSSRCRIIRRRRRHNGQVFHHRPRGSSLDLVHQVAPTVHQLLERTLRQVSAQLSRVPTRHRCFGQAITLQTAREGNPTGVLPQVPDSQVTAAFGRRPNCHTLRHQWPSGWRPIQSLHQGPTQKSPRALSAVREVRQIRRAPSAQGRVSEKAQRPSSIQPDLDKAPAVRLWAGQP
jgi:hypothetical protein